MSSLSGGVSFVETAPMGDALLLQSVDRRMETERT